MKQSKIVFIFLTILGGTLLAGCEGPYVAHRDPYYYYDPTPYPVYYEPVIYEPFPYYWGYHHHHHHHRR